MRGALAVGPVLAITVLAGCIASPSAPLDALEGPPGRDFRIDLQGCVEGGGHTLYNERPYMVMDIAFTPPEWTPYDVREDLDYPLLGSSREPIVGPGHGYYHATLACDAWTYQGEERGAWSSGHVGIRVEPPPFDTGGADRHYLISTVPVPTEDLRATLRGLGIPATVGEGLIELEPAWHSVLHDEINGTYESFNVMQDKGPVDDHVVRLWFTLQVEEGVWRPVSLDMTTVGASRLVDQGHGKFSHQKEDHHDEEPGPLDPVWGQVMPGSVPGLGWTGFSRVVTLGPQPDVELAHGFVHH